MPNHRPLDARILIVDDQQANVSLLEGLLKKQGYSNQLALTDSRKVVETFREWEPDIILLDLMMPYMDGFAVMQALKPLIAQNNYLPILVLTADVTSEAKSRALSEGAMDFLTKPFDANEVILRVNNLLQTRFLHLQLQNQNAILEEKVRERTAELERTHQKLESILNSAGEGIYGVDLEGKTTFMNPSALHMLGYSLTEVMGQRLHALIHHTRPDGSPYPLEECPIYAAFMDAQARRRDDEVFWRKDGSSFYVEYTSTPLWERNEIVGAVVTFNDITERTQAEEALRQRELEFRSLAENIPDIVARFDRQLRHVYINDVIESITGIPAESFIGKTNQDLSMPESKVELWDNKLRHVFDSGQAVTLEFDYSSPTGMRYFESRLIPELGPTGRVEKVLSVVRDITERKQAEEEIKYHARLLRRINDAVIATDDQFRITAWNRAAEKMYGWSSEEAIGRNVSEILSFGLTDEQRAEARESLNESSVSRREVIHQRKDGRTVYVEANTIALMDERGKSTGYVTVNRDITDRKRAEEQLQRQLQRLNALRVIDTAISSSFDLKVVLAVVLQQINSELGVDAGAVLRFDPHLRMLEYAASRGFYSTALHHTRLKLGEGYAGQIMLKRKIIHITDLMETDSQLAHALHLKHESFVEYYGVPLIAKGEVRGVLEVYHRSHLRTDSEWLKFLETLAGQAAIAIDNAQLFENLQRAKADLEQRVIERTAELHRANVELEHANRAKDEFLAMMSHELRTPLNSILGLSESLLEQRRGSLNEHQQNSLQIIGSSGRHLLDLINDILDLSKIQAGKFDFYPQPISVEEICRSSLAFVKAQAAKKSITITYHNDAAIPRIYADPRRLKQILVNLLTNAVKFTPEKGNVTLQVGADPEQDLIQFSVIDTGIGIALEDLQQLFQPFVQVDSSLNRQYEGTGLGLALIQKLTELHGGSVQVESEVGKGSRFTVNLACKQDEIVKLETLQTFAAPPISQPAEKMQASAEHPAARGVILLAEDNSSNILTMGEYLESHGYEVVIAHDGLEAIRKAEIVNPDIILMDIQMPVLDGLDAIARLRGDPRFASTPIIALTALAMPGDRELCLQKGANDYISKPVSLKTLREMIENLLQTRTKP